MEQEKRITKVRADETKEITKIETNERTALTKNEAKRMTIAIDPTKGPTWSKRNEARSQVVLPSRSGEVAKARWIGPRAIAAHLDASLFVWPEIFMLMVNGS